MKLPHPLRRLWLWLPPQTWPETFAVIYTMLIGFLAAAYLLDWLKGVFAR